METIVTLVIVLVVVGVALWAINAFIPMDPRVKQIINVIVIIAIVLWLLVKFLLPLARSAGG